MWWARCSAEDGIRIVQDKDELETALDRVADGSREGAGDGGAGSASVRGAAGGDGAGGCGAGGDGTAMRARRVWGWPLMPIYAVGLAVRDGMRRLGWLRVRRLEWPVISVGSLSAGGAGKTPVVIALAELLQGLGWDVDVLSRGYGRMGCGVERVDLDAADAARRFGDEPVMIARTLQSKGCADGSHPSRIERGMDGAPSSEAGSEIPVWVGAERFAAGVAAEAVEERLIAASDRRPGAKAPESTGFIQGAEAPAASEEQGVGCICWMMGFSIGGWRGRWMWCW